MSRQRTNRLHDGRISTCSFMLCLAVSISLAPALARADEFSQITNHSIRLVRGTVVVDARVGDILIEGWDKERVDVEAEKVVRADSDKDSKQMFDRIRLAIGTDEEERTVFLKTLYPPRRPWRPFRGESKLTINLRMKIPRDANLILKCVDGDVRVRGIKGNEQLKVNYGSVEISVPSVWDLKSVQAHTWLGYVENNLQPLPESDSGISRRVIFWNPQGRQEITINVHMGGVFVYGDYN